MNLLPHGFSILGTHSSAKAGEATARSRTIVLLLLLVPVLLWSYWPAVRSMSQRWAHDPQYSHGFLIPLFAAVILWFRRDSFPVSPAGPCWWGLPVLLGGVALRFLAVAMDIEPLEAFSLLPTLAGCVWLVGGTALIRWSWPAIAFLGFMLPLPFTVEVALAHPLRRLATISSTYLLQTLGLPAFAEGNVILIDRYRLGVAEACSGLGMLMTFFALATALALIVERPLTDRLLLVLGAIPIALVANIARITATALAFRYFGERVAQAIFHDLAGWLMMPLALVFLWLELRFLDRLLIPADRSLSSPNLPLPVATSTGPPDHPHPGIR